MSDAAVTAGSESDPGEGSALEALTSYAAFQRTAVRFAEEVALRPPT